MILGSSDSYLDIFISDIFSTNGDIKSILVATGTITATSVQKL